jgi:glycosyltransferase involved in cell wall biosynthesis
MPKITALIHTHNDGARIGRTLDSLRPCDQVLVIDHESDDNTAEMARKHGAEVKTALPGVDAGAYAVDARHKWILCLLPTEALSEGLEAALFEWKQQEPDDAVIGYSVRVRDNTEDGWKISGRETRLVNRERINWTDRLPPHIDNAPQLTGDLLRFRD